MSGEERFLVTGSEGCIGSWVVKNLAEEGRSCLALDLSPSGRLVGQIMDPDRLAGVTFVTGDIALPGLLDALIAEHGITRIVHLAALQIPLVRADPARGAMVNVVGTVRVFEAARRFAGQVRNVVYASSAAALGPPDPDGDAVPSRGAPVTLYGVFKSCNEGTAHVYALDWAVSSVGLRPWAVFGPGRDQGLTAAPTHAMKAAILGVRYHIPFGGRMDMQYADDVARAFVQAALTSPKGAFVYNLRGASVSMEEVIAVIEGHWPQAKDLLTCGTEPLPIPADLGPPQLEQLIEKPPRTPFATAVDKTLDHFRRLAEAGLLTRDELQGV